LSSTPHGRSIKSVSDQISGRKLVESSRPGSCIQLSIL
jgi:hypothetical protein